MPETGGATAPSVRDVRESGAPLVVQFIHERQVEPGFVLDLVGSLFKNADGLSDHFAGQTRRRADATNI